MNRAGLGGWVDRSSKPNSLLLAHAGHPASRLIRGNAFFAEILEDLSSLFPRDLANLAWPEIVIAGRITERPQQIVEPGNDGAVRDTEFGLDILDDAAVANESIEKGELLVG